MTPFWIALQFLTIVPVQLKQMPSVQQNAQSLLYYPCIGALMGTLLWLTSFGLSALPISLLSALIVVIWVWMTGGLHLDGLADTSDAWVGGFGNTQRTLDIMKDPSCGPIGVLSLLICIGLKYATVYSLLLQQQHSALLFIPILARLSPLLWFLTTPYVRKKGLGQEIAQYLERPWAWCVLVGVSCIIIYLQTFGWVMIMVFLAVFGYLRYQFMQRLAGVTGDTIGASIEILEVALLLALVMSVVYLNQYIFIL